MMHSGTAISRRRTFVKNITGSVFSCQDTLVENTLFSPETKDILFQSNETDLAVDLAKHG